MRPLPTRTSPRPAPRRRGWRLVVAAGAALAVGACGSPSRSSATRPTGSVPAATGAPGGATVASAPSTATDPRRTVPSGVATTATTSTTPTTRPRPVDGPGWRIVAESSTAVLSDVRTVAEADGASVTLVRFRAGHFRLVLHVGSEDPPSGGVDLPADAGSAISATERPRLLGAFNGGFKQAAGAGGFEVDGTVLEPLVPGDASLVIDADGAVHVGVWGAGLPRPGERVVSVRQNLVPLVLDGAATPSTADVAAWGATVGGTAVARSAVGTDRAGDLIYAGSLRAVPADLAAALLAAGATTAMQLDINPEWVQADVAHRAGGPLTAAVAGQNRPADQYLTGWTRDFLAVLRP